jgi:hypothetical protein
VTPHFGHSIVHLYERSRISPVAGQGGANHSTDPTCRDRSGSWQSRKFADSTIATDASLPEQAHSSYTFNGDISFGCSAYVVERNHRVGSRRIE